MVAACLPDLDPARFEVACQGALPDGFLDPGEACDDGNLVEEDGCDSACRVVCPPPAVLDGATGRCYFTVGAASPDEASAVCRSRGAALLTLRSEDERRVIAPLLSASPGLWLTAYRLVTGEISLPTRADGVTARAALPWPVILFGEPGILFRAQLDPQPSCPGCFSAGLEGVWWREDPARDLRLAIGPEGQMIAVDPAVPGVLAGALCERPLAATPPNPCPAGPTCPPGARGQIRLGGRVYTAFSPRSSWDEARSLCLQSGAELWVIDSETEREGVLRALGLVNQGEPYLWVGLRHEVASPWRWLGDAQPPIPWGLEPSGEDGKLLCGVLPAQGNSFALGLVVPAPCASDPGVGFGGAGVVCEGSE